MNENHYEVIILGTGPAGLQAAIPAARTKVSVLVLGRQPKSSLFKAHSESLQYIVTDKKQETNIPGIYAAGDICGPPWQMATAVGEGCVAGLQAAAFATKHR